MAALGEGENWPPPSYAKAKKMKSLTLHPHGCPRAAKGYSSSLLHAIPTTPIPKSWRGRDPNRSGTYEIFSLHYFTLQCQIHDRPFSSELQLRPNDSRFTPPVQMPVTTL